MRSFALAALGALYLLGCASASAQNTNQMPTITAITEPRVLVVRVFSTDLARSLRFYEEVFGMHMVANHGDREWTLMFNDTSRPGIVLALTDAQAPRANGSFAVGVPDIDAVVAAVPAAGGTVTRAPPAQGRSGYRIAIIADPDGASIEVIQPDPASATPH